MPICQRYLNRGAYGYFGSSTIAYGPAEGNGAADLITQYFLLAVLEGASLGRAALIARQKFVEQVGELDPVDLKTLGQFNLLGDPSIHPVVIVSPTAVPKGVDVEKSNRDERQQRRAKLREVGEMLQETKPTASQKASKARKSPTVRKALANIARKAGIAAKKEFTAYAVKMPKGPGGADPRRRPPPHATMSPSAGLAPPVIASRPWPRKSAAASSGIASTRKNSEQAAANRRDDRHGGARTVRHRQ
jgi:hypothetical protein